MEEKIHDTIKFKIQKRKVEGKYNGIEDLQDEKQGAYDLIFIQTSSGERIGIEFLAHNILNIYHQNGDSYGFSKYHSNSYRIIEKEKSKK